MVIERRSPFRIPGPAHLRRAGLAVAAALAFTPGSIAWSQTQPRAQTQVPAPPRVQNPAAPQNTVQPPSSTAVQSSQVSPANAARSLTPAWRVEPRINAMLIATDNSGYSDADGESDQVLDLTPRLRLSGRGARTELDADIGVHVLRYLQDTQNNRVLPDARAELRSTLVERWAYLDARLVSEQTAEDPFGGQADASSSVNRLTSTRLRLSPYLDHRFSPTLSLQARSDNAWTWRNGGDAEDEAGDPRRDAFEQRHFLRLAQQTARLGLAGELQQLDVRYRGESEDVLSLTGARAVATLGFGPQFQVGPVIGRERSRFAGNSITETVYGVRGLWLPTERTRLRASAEHRFFGTGWEAELTHRSPMWAMQLRTFREPTALPVSQVQTPFATDVTSLLDAILTTRHPDPVQRRALVRSMVDSLELPEVLDRPIETYSDQAQLQTGHSASVALLGRRTTASLTVQAQRLRQLASEDGGEAPAPTLGADNKQRGVGLDLRHRLTRQTTLGVRGRASRIEGVGALAGIETTEKSLRLSLSHALSAQASVTVGVRRQLLDSTLRRSADENAVFVGLSQRF